MRVHLSILTDNQDAWASGAELLGATKQDISFCDARMAWPGQQEFRSDILYVLPDTVPVPKGQEDVLFLKCGALEAEPLEPNVISVLSCLKPETLCSALSDFILRFLQWENQMNLAIVEGKNEQDLLTLSEPFLRNPVIIQDASFSYLAGTSDVGEVDEFYEQLKSGVDPTPEVVLSLIENRQSEDEMKFGQFPTGQRYHIATGPSKRKYKEVYVDVETSGGSMRSVHMCLSKYPLSRGLLLTFGIFCDKLLKMSTIRLRDECHQGGVAINDFIFGRLITDGEVALSLAQSDGITAPYMIAALDAGVLGRAILKHTNTVLKGVRAFLYKDKIYIYVPLNLEDDTSPQSLEKQEQQLLYFCQRYHVKMGESGQFSQLKDMRLAVMQAARTLELSGLEQLGGIQTEQPLKFYRDVALLDVVDCYRRENPIESYAPVSFLRVSEGDRKGNANNRYVAEQHILNGCSVAQTAKKLFMHKNSVLYRIERMKSLYGLDFTDRQENQRFLLACLAAGLEEHSKQKSEFETEI